VHTGKEILKQTGLGSVIKSEEREKNKRTQKPTFLSKLRQRRITCNTVMRGSSRRPASGMLSHRCPNMEYVGTTTLLQYSQNPMKMAS